MACLQPFAERTTDTMVSRSPAMSSAALGANSAQWHAELRTQHAAPQHRLQACSTSSAPSAWPRQKTNDRVDAQRPRSTMCLAATSAVIGLRAWQGGGSRRRRTAVKQASSCGATTVEHQDEETFTYGKGGTLVVAGPSGVGKTTIINQMLADEELRDQIGYVVSHTTRPPT
eukprot:6462464-Amphidinium_carterae.1